MLTLSADDIARYRLQLADYPDAIAALDTLSDCDGDLEDAAITLALRSGQEPDTNDRWLEGYAKRFRHILCNPALRTDLEANNLSALAHLLTTGTTCPPLLVAPVALFVITTGGDTFCHSFDHGLVQS